MFHCLPFLVAVCLPAADEPVFSGPQPGEMLTPFVVIGALGDDADKKIDLVAAASGKPTVIVFVHGWTRPAFGLANVVMRLVEDRGPEKVVGGLIYLTDDPTDTLNRMPKVAQHFPKKITIGVSPDGKEGPGAYGLNRNVSVTVLVAKESKVTANFALVQPSLQVDAPKIFKAIADVLGEEKVPKVADYSPPNRGLMDVNLRPLLAPLIDKKATDDEVVAAAKKIERLAAKNRAARIKVGDAARKIISENKLENYGTKKCQEYLTKWSKEFVSKPRPTRSTETNKTRKED